MSSPFQTRRRALNRLISQAKLDALVITHPANWYYLTGFTGEAGVLIVGHGPATLVTDGRFTTQVRQETSSIRLVQQKGSLMESTGRLLREKGIKRVGFDPAQTSVAQLNLLKKAAGSRSKWIPAAELVGTLRARKEPSELARMRQAAILAGDTLTGAIKLLKPGVMENEIAAEIEYQMRRGGASGPAFETIVAFGERSALPHARPTAKRLRKNELVVLDLGAILAHYCSAERSDIGSKSRSHLRGCGCCCAPGSGRLQTGPAFHAQHGARTRPGSSRGSPPCAGAKDTAGTGICGND
jgi:Xaa-Pro aminopeptidase